MVAASVRIIPGRAWAIILVELLIEHYGSPGTNTDR